MGHYDDAREAHEKFEKDRQFEAKAKRFIAVMKNRSSVELGVLLNAYEEILERSKNMLGTQAQHQSLEVSRQTISQFYIRRDKDK